MTTDLPDTLRACLDEIEHVATATEPSEAERRKRIVRLVHQARRLAGDLGG